MRLPPRADEAMASCVGKELDELGSGEDPGLHTKRTITAFQLIIITFFLTSGGPFGIEPTVGAAGLLLHWLATPATVTNAKHHRSLLCASRDLVGARVVVVTASADGGGVVDVNRREWWQRSLVRLRECTTRTSSH